MNSSTNNQKFVNNQTVLLQLCTEMLVPSTLTFASYSEFRSLQIEMRLIYVPTCCGLRREVWFHFVEVYVRVGMKSPSFLMLGF